MSEVNNYKCDQCGKVETNLLYWWVLKGNLWLNEDVLRFTVGENTNHWCSTNCLKQWIDSKSKLIDGKVYEVKI